MSARAKWILGSVVVVLLIVGAISAASLGGYDPTARPPSPLEGREAPGFDLALVAGAGAGDRVSLEALRGEVVALDFWASWCAPCRQSIPILNRVHERYGSSIRLYGLNVESGSTNERVRAAHRTFAADFPSLQDDRYQAQNAYAVRSIPTLVLIDRSGMIRYVETGVPDEDAVSEMIDELVAEPR